MTARSASRPPNQHGEKKQSLWWVLYIYNEGVVLLYPESTSTPGTRKNERKKTSWGRVNPFFSFTFFSFSESFELLLLQGTRRTRSSHPSLLSLGCSFCVFFWTVVCGGGVGGNGGFFLAAGVRVCVGVGVGEKRNEEERRGEVNLDLCLL